MKQKLTLVLMLIPIVIMSTFILAGCNNNNDNNGDNGNNGHGHEFNAVDSFNTAFIHNIAANLQGATALGVVLTEQYNELTSDAFVAIHQIQFNSPIQLFNNDQGENNNNQNGNRRRRSYLVRQNEDEQGQDYDSDRPLIEKVEFTVSAPNILIGDNEYEYEQVITQQQMPAQINRAIVSRGFTFIQFVPLVENSGYFEVDGEQVRVELRPQSALPGGSFDRGAYYTNPLSASFIIENETGEIFPIPQDVVIQEVRQLGFLQVNNRVHDFALIDGEIIIEDQAPLVVQTESALRDWAGRVFMRTGNFTGNWGYGWPGPEGDGPTGPALIRAHCPIRGLSTSMVYIGPAPTLNNRNIIYYEIGSGGNTFTIHSGYILSDQGVVVSVEYYQTGMKDEYGNFITRLNARIRNTYFCYYTNTQLIGYTGNYLTFYNYYSLGDLYGTGLIVNRISTTDGGMFGNRIEHEGAFGENIISGNLRINSLQNSRASVRQIDYNHDLYLTLGIIEPDGTLSWGDRPFGYIGYAHRARYFHNRLYLRIKYLYDNEYRYRFTFLGQCINGGRWGVRHKHGIRFSIGTIEIEYLRFVVGSGTDREVFKLYYDEEYGWKFLPSYYIIPEYEYDDRRITLQAL